MTRALITVLVASVLALALPLVALAAAFEVSGQEVRVTGKDSAVLLFVLDLSDNPVESAVVPLQKGRATYMVRYQGPFKVRVSDLTDEQAWKMAVLDQLLKLQRDLGDIRSQVRGICYHLGLRGPACP